MSCRDDSTAIDQSVQADANPGADGRITCRLVSADLRPVVCLKRSGYFALVNRTPPVLSGVAVPSPGGGRYGCVLIAGQSGLSGGKVIFSNAPSCRQGGRFMDKAHDQPASGVRFAEQQAYNQLQCYTLEHGGPEFIHQHVVDAWAAQYADENSKPIVLPFTLAGLYLHLEKGVHGTAGAARAYGTRPAQARVADVPITA